HTHPLHDALPISRRELRPTPQTRPVSIPLRGRRGFIERAVLTLREPRRAHGAAIDPRRRDADEEHAIEARVSRTERIVQCVAIHGCRLGSGARIRTPKYSRTVRGRSPFSDFDLGVTAPAADVGGESVGWGGSEGRRVGWGESGEGCEGLGFRAW